MLKTLFKHEMKASSRLLLPLYLVLIVLTIMDRIVLSLDIFSGALAIIPGFVTFAYILALVAIVVVSFVIIVLRFYKNLMSDEGYLMFTLPVKTHELINSKLIASIIWTIASIVAIVASLFAVFATPKRIDLLLEAIEKAVEGFNDYFGALGVLIIIEIIIMTVLSLINNALQIYASIALGQLFNGHKVLGSFAAYIGISTVMQVVVTVIMIIASVIFKKSFTGIDSIPNIIFPISIFFLLVSNIAYYYITNYMFKKKLNLE